MCVCVCVREVLRREKESEAEIKNETTLKSVQK